MQMPLEYHPPMSRHVLEDSPDRRLGYERTWYGALADNPKFHEWVTYHRTDRVSHSDNWFKSFWNDFMVLVRSRTLTSWKDNHWSASIPNQPVLERSHVMRDLRVPCDEFDGSTADFDCEPPELMKEPRDLHDSARDCVTFAERLQQARQRQGPEGDWVQWRVDQEN
ncbi:hypothetical protein JX265_006326 [Neoarthrinium moseri]|uniref:Uncharacterized protein n=1 Tax=Neoarthrinium moseri TaxID=1658444 RepID=A0A9Q0APN0_9PEZI|nr:hypothetical protein JX265_006326 [Neoarthrinium moseri]